MALLPNTYNIIAAQGSQWSNTFFLQNSDGTPVNITGKIFELAIRRAVTDTGAPLVSVNSTASTGSGQITVNVPAGSVQVTLTPAATGSLIHGGGVYSLWMDQGLPDATCMVAGTFYANPAVAP